MYSHRSNLSIFSDFVSVNPVSLQVMVLHLKPSTCSLDILPRSFYLKQVFSNLSNDLLHIVNNSLCSGFFPTQLITSIIKPILKKYNLEYSSIIGTKQMQWITLKFKFKCPALTSSYCSTLEQDEGAV